MRVPGLKAAMNFRDIAASMAANSYRPGESYAAYEVTGSGTAFFAILRSGALSCIGSRCGAV